MEAKQAITSIHQVIDRFIETARGVPSDILTWNPGPEKWSVMEIVCHVEEVIGYWLSEIDQLAATPGIEWGRGLQHPGRLAAVANAGKRSFNEVIDSINGAKSNVETTLARLTEEQLNVASPSRNPNFGMKPISFIIDHLFVEHIEKHINQIKRNLSEFPFA